MARACVQSSAQGSSSASCRRQAAPGWLKAGKSAVKWAALEAASSSARGSGSAGPARAARRALSRRGSRPRALPRGAL
eukprot:scaffold71223_cov45-Phaeocystis_antarctica.AAC.1